MLSSNPQGSNIGLNTLPLDLNSQDVFLPGGGVEAKVGYCIIGYYTTAILADNPDTAPVWVLLLQGELAGNIDGASLRNVIATRCLGSTESYYSTLIKCLARYEK